MADLIHSLLTKVKFLSLLTLTSIIWADVSFDVSTDCGPKSLCRNQFPADPGGPFDDHPGWNITDAAAAVDSSVEQNISIATQVIRLILCDSTFIFSLWIVPVRAESLAVVAIRSVGITTIVVRMRPLSMAFRTTPRRGSVYR